MVDEMKKEGKVINVLSILNSTKTKVVFVSKMKIIGNKM